MKKVTTLITSLLILAISVNAFANPPVPHQEVLQDQELRDIRWQMTMFGLTYNIDFSDASYQMIQGTDALSILEDYYAGTPYFEAEHVRYVRSVLANENSLAIIVHDNDYYTSVFIPWNTTLPPDNDVPSEIAEITKRGYLIPVEGSFIDYLDSIYGNNFEKDGEAGKKEDSAACGCVQNLAPTICAACNYWAVEDAWGSGYEKETSIFNTYKPGQIIPVYGK